MEIKLLHDQIKNLRDDQRASHNDLKQDIKDLRTGEIKDLQEETKAIKENQHKLDKAFKLTAQELQQRTTLIASIVGFIPGTITAIYWWIKYSIKGD